LSLYEDNVCDKIQQRADVGKRKYGVTMERDDLSTIEWLVHLQEELMDAALYIQAAREEMQDMSEELLLKNINVYEEEIL